ncbi:MAG: hypothetical protein V3V33_05055 [Candidatus Lokiarchaeia archaeon]
MKINDFKSLIYEKEDKYVIDILSSTLDRKNNGLYKANVSSNLRESIKSLKEKREPICRGR